MSMIAGEGQPKREGDLHWRPAVDVNRVVLGAHLGGIVALLVVRSIVKTLRRRR